MGKKVNPIALRIGSVLDWQSRWFDNKNYKETLLEDYKLREQITKRLKDSGFARVEIERSINSIRFLIFVSKPGMVIGRGGSGLEELKKFINKILSESKKGKNLPKVDLKIETVKEPNLDPDIVSRNIAEQLIKRLPYKRVLNSNAERVMQAGAKGVKILLAGRINGAAIHRKEKIQMGSVPFSTIRARVLYASNPSLTKAGYIGVKVWINLGDK